MDFCKDSTSYHMVHLEYIPAKLMKLVKHDHILELLLKDNIPKSDWSVGSLH